MTKAPTLDRYIRQSEIFTFFKSFQPHEQRQSLCFKLMAYCGLRIGEAVQVNTRDFLTRDYRSLKVESNKGNNQYAQGHQKKSIQPLPKWLSEEVRQYVTKYEKRFKKGYIFYPDGHGSRNPHITKDAIRMFLTRKRLNLGGGFTEVIQTCQNGNIRYRISPHSFRRWYITQVYKVSGNDIKLAKTLGRHESIETTEVYINGFELAERAPEILEALAKV